jgi:hypothetical protein
VNADVVDDSSRPDSAARVLTPAEEEEAAALQRYRRRVSVGQMVDRVGAEALARRRLELAIGHGNRDPELDALLEARKHAAPDDGLGVS